MFDLSRRSTEEVLEDHLRISQEWSDRDFAVVLEEDLQRNVAEDVVVITNRGIVRGHDGVRELARQLADELPEHRAFRYTFRAVAGKMGFLEWSYEDSRAVVRDGVDSYLIENGKIVAQTIHYTVEPSIDSR
jgi:hypothetical protein